MKRLIFISLFLISFSSFSQDYRHSLGARVGYTSGIAYKRFFNDIASIETVLSFQRSGAQLFLLRQFHHPVFLKYTDKIFFYFGYGFHFGYSYWSNRRYEFSGVAYRKRESSIGLGIDANIGLEYHMDNYPLVLGIDYKPFYEINIPRYFRQNHYDFAVSLKYIIE